MMAPLVLVAIAVVVGLAGSRHLASATWPARSPALGVLAWLTVGATAFLSLVLAGLALAIPRLPANEGIAEFFHACSAMIREHYATPGGGIAAVIGGGLAAVLLLRFASSLVRGVLAGRLGQARQEDLLNIVGSRHPERDVMVLEHPTPAAYCLPGRSRRIVVTKGALEVLSDLELRQVLAHERAHIESRHHLATLMAQALDVALVGRLGTARIPGQVAELLEMHADDAADQSQRSALARAVVLLAGGGLPVGAMGAGTSALTRVRRLSGPPEPVTTRERWGVIGAAAAMMSLPVAIALTPGVMSVLVHYCPMIS